MANKSSVFTLTGTSLVEGFSGINSPTTITLTSSAATRKIELSGDNGLTYFTPQYDFIGTTSLVLYLNGPVTNVKATGVANDVLTMTSAA